MQYSMSWIHIPDPNHCFSPLPGSAFDAKERWIPPWSGTLSPPHLQKWQVCSQSQTSLIVSALWKPTTAELWMKISNILLHTLKDVIVLTTQSLLVTILYTASVLVAQVLVHLHSINILSQDRHGCSATFFLLKNNNHLFSVVYI